MAQITPEVKEAIQIAIQLEKDGRQFFEKAAEETKNELGKKMFLKLASDEVRHLVTFEKMFKSLADPKTWKELLKETDAHSVGKNSIGRTIEGMYTQGFLFKDEGGNNAKVFSRNPDKPFNRFSDRDSES